MLTQKEKQNCYWKEYESTETSDEDSDTDSDIDIDDAENDDDEDGDNDDDEELGDVVTDKEGNTIFMQMILCGRLYNAKKLLKSVKSILNRHEENTEELVFAQNTKKQNILHLACMSPQCEKVLRIFHRFVDDFVQSGDLLVPDHNSNSPLIYLASNSCTKVLARYIGRGNLWERCSYMVQQGGKEADWLQMFGFKTFRKEVYSRRVLRGPKDQTYVQQFSGMLNSHQKQITFDESIIALIKFAMVSYSLDPLISMDDCTMVSKWLFIEY